MPIVSLTTTSVGQSVLPESTSDWRDWVSAGRVRNWRLQDPLLDWLDEYGEARGYAKDAPDPRTDMGAFLMEKGNAFEAAVMAYLATTAEVVRIGRGQDIRSMAMAEETFAAMRDGAEIIHQGVLRHAESRTYGAPDLLVRSDILNKLFPDAVSAQDAVIRALDLPAYHYRVVDIKFTGLHLLAGGALGSTGSSLAYSAQVAIYNRALGALQGYEPPTAYLMGRGYTQTVRGVPARGTSCMDRVAPVRVAEALADADRACAWVRRVRMEGGDWRAEPEPTVPELRPNMSHAEDQPWHGAKKRIAAAQEELTLLWQVGVGKRNAAIDTGITRWKDPRATPEVLGVTGEQRAPVLRALLDVNRTAGGPAVRPAHISADLEAWREVPKVEFYVDFETVSDLDDDFSRIPQRGGQPLIFMVGCGHVEHGRWQFRCFTADDLTEGSEGTVVDAWLAHMEAVRTRMAPQLPAPRVFHWSPAETSFLSVAFNSAVARHPDCMWQAPNWYDFLARVVRAEPVVVRGALGFGLKAFAKALRAHKLIETVWSEGPADGLGAMVGAWWCAKEARRLGKRLIDVDLMQEIAAYNEVDTKVMMEIVAYLRDHH